MAEGIEKTIALNLLVPFLLSSLLLECLQKSQDARIVITASSGQSNMAKPDLTIKGCISYLPND